MSSIENLKNNITDLKEKQDRLFNDIFAILDQMEEDKRKFYERGNKSAGMRLRSSIQKIRKLIASTPELKRYFKETDEMSKNLRKEISDRLNSK